MDKSKVWGVADVSLIAYLMSDDFKVVEAKRVERFGKTRVEFFFDNTEELHLAIKDFKENDYLKKYNTNLKEVKQKIFEVNKGDKQ